MQVHNLLPEHLKTDKLQKLSVFVNGCACHKKFYLACKQLTYVVLVAFDGAMLGRSAHYPPPTAEPQL